MANLAYCDLHVHMYLDSVGNLFLIKFSITLLHFDCSDSLL